MGMSHCVYVGAYLVIEAEPVEYLDGPFCPKGHGRMGGDFCSKCGAKMKMQKQLRAARLWDLTDREDELFQPNSEWGPAQHVILAFGNKTNRLPDRICDLDRNDLEVIPIMPEDVSRMIHNLETNYADIISELREVAEVEIHFGVISYVM